MHEVFQIKKAVKDSQNILRPFFLAPDSIIVSTASNNGTNPIRSSGAVKGIGGQANQRMKALKSANR